MPSGPQPVLRQIRRKRALEITNQLRDHFQDRLVALGVYGSIAHDSDGPYSDIEIHCVISGSDIDDSIEWSAGEWKAEVDILSLDVIVEQAAQVDCDWSITHGAYVYVWPIYDPSLLFHRLKETVYAHPEACFIQAMKNVIVGEIYEVVGKIRNLQNAQDWVSLPYLTLAMTLHSACLVGLANHHLFTSLAGIFRESLTLPNIPEGFPALCKLVTNGRLDQPTQITPMIDTCWEGIETWAASKGIILEDQFSNLLAAFPLTGTS
jgi:kanamycin nucleotidyltransferase